MKTRIMKTKIRKHFFRITGMIIALSLCFGLLAGCRSADDDASLLQITGSDEERFDILMDELFAEWVSGDALTMNYFLADPYSLNIERPETTFGEVISPESIERAKQETQELSDFLDTIRYEALRYDQQIVYDILARSIEINNILSREEDFNYYTGYIRPLNGIQVQLPILLAEFNFYTVEDIERYLDLISDTKRYFDDIIEFERERSRRGFFLSEANVDSVTEQIESFLENREDNFLITVINERIDNYEGLSAAQREQFKQRNTDLVLGNVLPAYETLLSAMNELRGVGAREGGHARLPQGREFAHALLRLRIGTDRSVADIENMLEVWVDGVWMNIMTTLTDHPLLFDGLINDSLGQIAAGTPEDYIAILQAHTAIDFPPILPTRLEVWEVHESLQEHMSPAFYLAPAIDRFDDNVVYINPASIDDDLFLFTVLGHESYPGHMYQTVFFLQQSPHPIRTALSNIGYSEGWAVYVEMLCYFYAGLDEIEAEFLWHMRFFDMLLQAYIDFGVNVLGWRMTDVAQLLTKYNITDAEVVENLYNHVTGVPLFSVTYSLGYLEMIALKQDAERVLDDYFTRFDFHRFILEFGPAPYPVIRKHLNERILIEPATALAPAA